MEKENKFSKFKKGQRIEIRYKEYNSRGRIDEIKETGTIAYTALAYIEFQPCGSSGNKIIGRKMIIDITPAGRRD